MRRLDDWNKNDQDEYMKEDVTPNGVPRESRKRPGTRPQAAAPRPPVEQQPRPAPRPRRTAPAEPRQDASVPAREKPARVNVGYAPGRMNEEATRQVPAADPVRETQYVQAHKAPYGRDAKAYLEKRKQPFRVESEKDRLPDRPAHRALRICVVLLVAAGLLLSAWMLLKDRAGGIGKKTRETPQVISFDPQNTEGLIAPVELLFSVETGKDVDGIRLRAAGDEDLDTVVNVGDNADGRLWTMKMPVATGFTGTVRLQVRPSGTDEWLDTEHTADISVSTPLGVETAPVANTPEPAAQTPDPDNDDYYDIDAKAGTPAEAVTPAPAEAAEEAPAEAAAEAAEAMPAETQEPAPAEADEEDLAAWDADATPAVILTPGPTNTPAVTEPPATPTPPLTAEAAPEANPDLISQTIVYSSNTKKEKDYNRPAKELIHMPEADLYTKQKLGVMTFRGDNFRRNAVAGSLSAEPEGLSVLWQAEAGSARGTNATYYGYQWTGQPVIARWSAEIRSKSNITESKIEKSALKEVIIAGVDGVIRFLDLEDGKITRNSIKLGYPLKGTPSLHPRGYPFLSAGQFARKMRAKTGKIGLRQYNLYTQNELRLIDGLDGKYHRPLNDIGSFETSALIDRESDTLITAGTNGMLYLESLGTNFDYNTGVLQISPSITVMASRAKGQKSNALLAVESSLAAYDKYVFYADMGGILRCVDTNNLRPVWAVDTGDSVMAAVALDLTENRELNLYTANMLNNRKKGDGSVQIRRFDALSGRLAWTTEVGVFKSKKDKEKDNVGAKASPVIGQNGLKDLVFFTVTGLSEEGAGNLGLSPETPAALIALDKDTGRAVWSFGLESRSESSPIALYDDEGNGWILQCEQNGTVHLIEGRTGRQVSSLKLEAEIEASPAAYNNVVVIGTTGKNTTFVYGIEVRLAKEDDPAAALPEAAEAGEPEPEAGEPEPEAAEEAPGEYEVYEEEYEEGGDGDEEVSGGA